MSSELLATEAVEEREAACSQYDQGHLCVRR